jgi:hypothetical protein
LPGETDREGRQKSQYLAVLAFGDDANILATVKKGDAVYAEGALHVSLYEAEGKPPSINLMLKSHFIRRSAIGDRKPPREKAGIRRLAESAFKLEPHRREPNRVVGRFDFDDPLPDWGARQ